MAGTDRKVKRDARRYKILKKLQSMKQIDISETADQLGVTTPTLTNDIKELEKIIPNIERTYGGAAWKDKTGRLHNSEFLNSLQNQSENKQVIGKYLAQNLPGGSILAAGIGSTPYYVIKNFPLARLSDSTLVTSNFAILTHLEQETETKLDVYDLGGKFDPAHMGLTRVDSEFDIRKVLEGTGFPFDSFKGPELFNYCIITGKSLSLKNLNLTCNHIRHEMHLRHAYMRNSQNVYIVLDSSKISEEGKGYIETSIKKHLGKDDRIYVLTDSNLSNRDLVKKNLKEKEDEGKINEDIFHFVLIDDDGESKYLYGKRDSTP